MFAYFCLAYLDGPCWVPPAAAADASKQKKYGGNAPTWVVARCPAPARRGLEERILLLAKGVNLGFSQAADVQGSYDKMKAKVSEELKQHFRPEFLKRVDEIVVFPPLTQDQIISMVDMMIASLDKRLADKDMGIELTQPAKDLLARRGFDPVLGARPLRRTVQREIEDTMAEKMLFGDMKPGSIVLVDVATDDGEEPFSFTAMPKADLPDTPPVEAAGSTEGESLTGSSSA